MYKTEIEERKIKQKHQKVNGKEKIEKRRTERRFGRNKEIK